ncbi:type VII secretion-associated serine protease mycosin [Streptomyces zagrosensis]|uniref:Type VII secretion-associated serine protease mycosin n=1 Tax=Streptomyces zagrosensis TaxID=1042984 RepID=A0A7W9QHZ0_9ACTN|nr:type VII secretion-associated serine protease mycosin [Streptomyces zagrosensis]MBB5940033.1 type VII secretion-associated serine protease mycosin [Streptomyces zagrosensis]
MWTTRQATRSASVLAAALLTSLSAIPAASGTAAVAGALVRDDQVRLAADGELGAAPVRGIGLTPNGGGECTYPMKKQFAPRPWALQRVALDELWQETQGEGVKVAVIDTGVDDVNPQLATAVEEKSGLDLVTKGKRKDPSADSVGHGTKVAGIIAARPRAGTGFVGLAPEATIIPIRQNDEKATGTTKTMVVAIEHAIAEGARVINISQDTTKPLSHHSDLAMAVKKARQNDIVVVASAGNDGLDNKVKETYPAAYEGVLAVASSDRNNERAPFSQRGDFVGVAAPGVDIVSTVPGNGQCVDNGTSFSAPYVAGVAALLRAKYPDWEEHEVVAWIKQTADRSINGRDNNVGWGVVDPVRALSGRTRPVSAPTPDRAPGQQSAPEPARLTFGETAQERRERLATYALGATAVTVAVIVGTAIILRDRRRRGTEHRA